jgi:hypothetical protein
MIGYAAELHWWDTHTQMGPEGTLIPREVPEVEAEGPVPISHPTRQLRELQPDPALEEEEENSEDEVPEGVRRWGDSTRGGERGGLRRRGGVENFLGGMQGESCPAAL